MKKACTLLESTLQHLKEMGLDEYWTERLEVTLEEMWQDHKYMDRDYEQRKRTGLEDDP